MDGSRFDALLRSLVTRRSRRGLLGGLGILALPLPALLMPSFEVQSAARPGGRRHARQRRHEPDRLDAERRKKKKKKTRRKPRTLPPGTPPPTCAQRCAGCCAGETCQVGSSTGACGRGGAACATCGGTTPLCIDQTCQPCDVCANGCLYGTVQEAIAAAISGETIRLCAGVYTGNIVINKSLSLIGAGDGNGAGNTLLRGTGTDSVVFVTDDAQTVRLRHLRIAGGAAPSLGGAISNHADNLTLTDCTLNDNHGVNTGGAIANFLGTTLTMTRCTVSGNTARIGAGIDNQGTVNLIDSNITGNEASEFGGGIYSGGVVTLDSASRVTGNKAAFTGGGILNNGGTVQLIDSIVSENEAIGPSGGGIGGGIDNTHGGMMHLINSTVSDNKASQGGGINNSFGSSVTLDAASRVTGNKATFGPGGGGGIFNYDDSSVTLSSVDNVTGNTPENCAGKAVPLCES